MNPLLQKIPPGQVWIEVTDLPSALLAFDVLSEHSTQSTEDSYSCDIDTL